MHLSVKERVFIIQKVILQFLKNGQIAIDFLVKYFLQMLIIATILLLKGIRTWYDAGQEV